MLRRILPSTHMKWVLPCLLLSLVFLSIPVGQSLAGSPAMGANSAPAQASCPTTSTNTYSSGGVQQYDLDNPVRPAYNHADKNLALRYYSLTTGALDFVAYGSDDPVQPPQFATLFSPDRTPFFSNVYRANHWNWAPSPDPGTRGTAIASPSVTVLGLQTTAGEVLQAPTHGRDLGSPAGLGGSMVIFADADSITLHFTREDTAAVGYTVHIDGICTDPNLLALYNSLDNTTRNTYFSPRDGTLDYNLPALRAGQAIGTARGSEIQVALVDTGSFQDPRSRDEFWQIRPPRPSVTPTPITPTATSTPPGPLPVGLWQETDPRIAYSGTWLNWASSGPNGGSTRYTNQQGAMASFQFDGTGFTLYRLMSDTRGNMEVCIDGACQTVNNYSAALLWNQPVSFGGLAAGVHSAAIRNASSAYLDVDAIQVFSGSSATATPTMTATATATNTPGSGSSALPAGLHQETDPRIAYSGTWLNWASSGPNGGSTRYTNQFNGMASFQFDGTGFTLYRLMANTRGNMEVCIDGACQTINNYSAALLWNQPVSFGGLAAGVHSAAIRNASSAYLDVDAIQVFSGSSATATPTMTATATATNTPGSGSSALPAGLHQETDPRITYSGTWLNWASSGPNGGSTRYTNQQGAMASFTFDGTGFTLYRLKANTRGNMEVCIDGACQTVNNYSATLLWNQPISFGGLAAGVHSAIIRNASSAYLDVDAIQVAGS